MAIVMAMAAIVTERRDRMDQDNNKIDLMIYFDRFYRSFRRLAKYSLLIIVLSIAAFEAKEIVLFQTTYTSKATFIPSQDQEDIYNYKDNQSNKNGTLVATFNELLNSKQMRNIIRNTLDVQSVPATYTTKVVEGTNIVELSVTSSDPKDALNVANCIINNYSDLTSDVMSDVSITLLDAPTEAKNPDALPNYMNAGLKGLLVGLIISIIMTFLSSLVRRTILTSKDVRELLDLETIAKIPYVPDAKKRERRGYQLTLDNPGISNEFRHAFHNVEIKLEHGLKKDNKKVIMFTSTVPEEGKTLTSVNSALSLANKGYKVALIDCDLRNPSIASILKHPNATQKTVVDCLLCIQNNDCNT